MREITDQVTPDYASYRPGLAPSLLSNMKDLPQGSLDITPLDPVQVITRDMNFPAVSIGERANQSLQSGQSYAQDAASFNSTSDHVASPTDTSRALPEQLDTEKGSLTNNMIKSHLQKVADHFENYSNKLMSAISPHKNGAGKDASDNLTQSKCPFMKVANAVGLKYPKSSPGETT